MNVYNVYNDVNHFNMGFVRIISNPSIEQESKRWKAMNNTNKTKLEQKESMFK